MAGAGAAQPQLPRPWFRLGSITRPTTEPITAPEPPRPALVRPPLIRPPAHTVTETSEPTPPPPPPQSAAVPSNSKSPPTPPAALPRPTTSFPSSPSATKKLASPPTASFTTPVFPSPSSLHGHTHTPASSAHSSPPQKPPSPSATMPPLKSTPLLASDSNRRVALPPSPTHSDSPINRTFPSRSPSPSPVPSPAAPSPYQSPKLKLKPSASASPPSPLLLPPSQLQSVGQPKHDSIPQEVERKAVVVQKIVDKPAESDHFSSYHVHKPGFGKNGKQSVHRDDDQGKEKGMRAKNDEESNMRVMIMAGENRGAFMEVILCDKNNSHQIRGIKESENDEEGSVNNNHKGDHRSKKSMGTTRNSLPRKAFLNSNVQGINNSILLESAFNHHDPGIHIVYSRTPRSTNELEDGQQ